MKPPSKNTIKTTNPQPSIKDPLFTFTGFASPEWRIDKKSCGSLLFTEKNLKKVYVAL